MKERQISARQLGYGVTRLGSRAGIFSVSRNSVSYAYMLAELWGFKKWCTARRRLFGRVLSWWIWFCQTSLRNVYGFMWQNKCVRWNSALFKERRSPVSWQLAFFFGRGREHKTNCHVLQDPRKMSGHQKVTCGRRVSDFSKMRELESRDKFPFEALGWDRRRKSQRAMTRICSDLSRWID